MISARRPPLVIVGAGLAGLAAAVELASHHIPVQVLEQKLYGGGRAYSFTDSATGEKVDNGQHVLIAGYTSTMRFLKEIGSHRLVRIQDRPTLPFHHPQRGMCSFTLPRLPFPFHLISGILTTNLLNITDRLRLLRIGLDIFRLAERAETMRMLTVAEWLQKSGQTPESVRSFWDPLTLAIMNERAHVASAELFIRCLQRAFLSGTNSASLVLPSVGLTELFVTPACNAVVHNGGVFHFSTRAVEVGFSDDAATWVTTQDGVRHPASGVILAIPPWAIERVGLSDRIPIRSLPFSPIVSIHLWYPTDFMEDTELGLVGRSVQWVFNRRKIAESIDVGGHFSCVISAAGEFLRLTSDELTSLAEEDLHSVFGNAIGHSQKRLVIREKRATFSPRPEVESLRPPQETSIGGLFLAGDWTSTGLPGTIEGAVWSGYRCAELAKAWFLRH